MGDQRARRRGRRRPALALEELSPAARVVVRLFNTAIGRIVHRLAGDVTVL
jgi:hypothetical protein